MSALINSLTATSSQRSNADTSSYHLRVRNQYDDNNSLITVKYDPNQKLKVLLDQCIDGFNLKERIGKLMVSPRLSISVSQPKQRCLYLDEENAQEYLADTASTSSYNLILDQEPKTYFINLTDAINADKPAVAMSNFLLRSSCPIFLREFSRKEYRKIFMDLLECCLPGFKRDSHSSQRLSKRQESSIFGSSSSEEEELDVDHAEEMFKQLSVLQPFKKSDLVSCLKILVNISEIEQVWKDLGKPVEDKLARLVVCYYEDRATLNQSIKSFGVSFIANIMRSNKDFFMSLENSFLNILSSLDADGAEHVLYVLNETISRASRKYRERQDPSRLSLADGDPGLKYCIQVLNSPVRCKEFRDKRMTLFNNQPSSPGLQSQLLSFQNTLTWPSAIQYSHTLPNSELDSIVDDSDIIGVPTELSGCLNQFLAHSIKRFHAAHPEDLRRIRAYNATIDEATCNLSFFRSAEIAAQTVAKLFSFDDDDYFASQPSQLQQWIFYEEAPLSSLFDVVLKLLLDEWIFSQPKLASEEARVVHAVHKQAKEAMRTCPATLDELHVRATQNGGEEQYRSQAKSEGLWLEEWATKPWSQPLLERANTTLRTHRLGCAKRGHQSSIWLSPDEKTIYHGERQRQRPNHLSVGASVFVALQSQSAHYQSAQERPFSGVLPTIQADTISWPVSEVRLATPERSRQLNCLLLKRQPDSHEQEQQQLEEVQEASFHFPSPHAFSIWQDVFNVLGRNSEYSSLWDDELTSLYRTDATQRLLLVGKPPNLTALPPPPATLPPEWYTSPSQQPDGSGDRNSS